MRRMNVILNYNAYSPTYERIGPGHGHGLGHGFGGPGIGGYPYPYPSY